MSKVYVFYNPLAGHGKNPLDEELIKGFFKGEECVFCDMTAKETYESTVKTINKDDKLLICGGDGTLNRFLNISEGVPVECEILLYPCGSGNDFARDLGKDAMAEPFVITKYVQSLPTVTVKGKTCKFINNVGFGIDGYCSEEGDKQRASSDKEVNYTSIAINGLLFHYKPTTATVTVDGVKHVFEKAWLAPTMNGRYYGGGMNAAPAQDRLKNDTLSVMLFYGAGRIRTLAAFPSIFKGEHIKHKKLVTIITGKDIKVEFDSPRPLQIDGETVLDVTEYTAKAPTK
ncbi:MAG: diacylglycerol kinase family protein [Clostridia bacterium]|nr:diacylglycerol kinase family protein [Clostridia bacterium]